MRREHGLLMQGDQPAGGQWNYDGTNRKRFPANSTPPARQLFFPEETTRAVMALVEQRFPDHLGDLQEFGWPVTRPDALCALGDFVEPGLPNLGDYQDAMKAGAPSLRRSPLSPAYKLIP
jgi:deoxyribodipyrimidine photolyase-related protein